MREKLLHSLSDEDLMLVIGGANVVHDVAPRDDIDLLYVEHGTGTVGAGMFRMTTPIGQSGVTATVSVLTATAAAEISARDGANIGVSGKVFGADVSTDLAGVPVSAGVSLGTFGAGYSEERGPYASVGAIDIHASAGGSDATQSGDVQVSVAGQLGISAVPAPILGFNGGVRDRDLDGSVEVFASVSIDTPVGRLSASAFIEPGYYLNAAGQYVNAAGQLVNSVGEVVSQAYAATEAYVTGGNAPVDAVGGVE